MSLGHRRSHESAVQRYDQEFDRYMWDGKGAARAFDAARLTYPETL